jgi:hypothetical protein
MGKWSVKEHIGHINDLHALDVRRVEEFLSGAEKLTAADMSNRRTAEGSHRATPVAALLDVLHQGRETLTLMLQELTEREICSTAVHPRLGTRMRLIDWAQFVADHDDHHLASARNTLRVISGVDA